MIKTTTVAAVLSLLSTVACGGAPTTGSPPPIWATPPAVVPTPAADGGNTIPAIPQAFVSAQLGAVRDANLNNLCNQTSLRDVLDIGTSTGTCDPVTGRCSGNGPGRAIDGTTQINGNLQAGDAVHVQCSVAGTPLPGTPNVYAGVDVNVSATVDGPRGGTFFVAGHIDGYGNGTNIHSVLNVPFWDGAFSQNDCTVAATYVGGPVPMSPPVASGRLWVHLSCPKMLNKSGTQVRLMDGSQVAEACDGEADFIFENCSP